MTDNEQPTPDERQAYIDAWAERNRENPPTPRARLVHKVLAEYDLGFEKAMSEVGKQAHAGTLDNKVKELLFVVGYTAQGFEKQHIAWHTQAALRAGATPEEVLEALKVVFTVAGVIPFTRGVEAWAEVTGAKGIEPTEPL